MLFIFSGALIFDFYVSDAIVFIFSGALIFDFDAFLMLLCFRFAMFSIFVLREFVRFWSSVWLRLVELLCGCNGD